jgi:hypothetical protein
VHAYGLTQYPEWVDLIILSCQFCRVTTATNVVVEAMVGCDVGPPLGNAVTGDGHTTGSFDGVASDDCTEHIR